MTDASLKHGHQRRQSVHATVHPACPNCGAPGLYKAEERIREGWPRCYDPSRVDQPVGDRCPQCNHPRPSPRDQGEVWSRYV